MEIRKLQRTGGSSLTVTLPKKWINGNGLKDKSLLKISSPNLQTLILQPAATKKNVYKSTLKINDLTIDRAGRELIALYISGFDEIVVENERISPMQRNKIRSLSNYLVGFEIIDESAEKIILKNIFDPAKFPIPKNVEKMFLATISMFQDALIALADKDTSLAMDVIDRDFEIDRLYLVIKRQRHSLSQNKISEEDISLSLSDMHYYEDIATQIERIADHAVVIAKMILDSDKKVVGNINISTISNKILGLLDNAKIMVNNLDRNLAHEILDSISKLKKPIFSQALKSTEESITAGLLEESLNRVRGYTTNIAELTIDHSVEKNNK